ncbi:MAG: porin [Thiobacillus sp.]|nr:porin [Thiobacillus sp.]
MMKKILAAAIVSAFAAPAFAATANVDVYGKLHASVSMFDETVDAGAGADGIFGTADDQLGTNDLQFSSNASRIGFKGAEDLGGGLKAIWQIESGVNLDEGGDSFAGRNSFIGLSGGFGTALIGTHDTPLKLVGRAVDLFGDTMADSRNVLGGGSDLRAKNVAVYMTPNMGGFGIAAAYSTDPKNQGSQIAPVVAAGDTGDRADNGAYNVNATYKNGPLFLGLGYGDGDYHENNGLGAHMRGAAGFDMGAFKLVGQYDRLEDDTPAVGNGDYDAWMVGAAFTMGNIVLKANYMEGEYDNANAPEPTQWTAGVDYNLSKRSSVYALYAKSEDVVLGKGGGSSDQIVSGDTGGDNSVISLGMIHNF